MMRTASRVLLALALVCWAPPRAAFAQEEPSEVFLRAYQSFQAGEKLEAESAPQRALHKYQEALKLLEGLTASFPDWQPLVVEYRKVEKWGGQFPATFMGGDAGAATLWSMPGGGGTTGAAQAAGNQSPRR
ncbi:MAG: hypothetical protein N2322_07390 [Terrimicrobiaceae bacterium]|nr:hypothetical protein [Terrimicrobiaceae bacterium]